MFVNQEPGTRRSFNRHWLGAASLGAIALTLASPAQAQTVSAPNDAAPGIAAQPGATAGQQAEATASGETTGAAEQVATTGQAAEPDDTGV